MNNSITCIKNAIIVDKNSQYHLQNKNIYIQNGVILYIGNDYNAEVIEIDFEGDYISSGWMDLHTHVNPSVSIGLNPDVVGVKQGVTMVVDAGSCGTSNIDSFVESFSQYKTKVKLFLNISSLGLTRLDELIDNNFIDMQKNSEKIKEYRDIIVGIKIRASKSVMNDNMTKPFELARKLSDEFELPIMVHIGNAPPTLEHVMKYLNEKDIVTHCFHGKPSKVINDNNVLECVDNARKRGVKFDIGHGSASFNFFNYQEAIKNGLSFETISSDAHSANINGPVFSLSHVMSKFIAMNMPFDDVVDRVTFQVARVLNLEKYGRLEVGFVADFTRFNFLKKVTKGYDSDNNELDMFVSFNPKSVFVNGEEIKIR